MAWEDPPNIKYPICCPFFTFSPIFTVYTQLDSSAIPTNMIATLPILGLSDLIRTTFLAATAVKKD
jgi:hypothetical protein